MKKEKSIKKLKQEADSLFSELIRKRDKGICYTCNNKKHWKEQQCGHYISRNRLSLRYDDRNCHCQCVSCNIFKKGNMDVYAIRLLNQYGENILHYFQLKKDQSVKFSRADYEALIKHYKQKLRWKLYK